jgi:hypothetical protein
MWPFRKKTSSSNRLPIDGPWSVGKGQNDGKVMIVRVNTGYRRLGSLPGYEHQAGIAVPFRAPEPTGLPSPAENVQLDDVEDAIHASMQEQAESLLVAIITTGGMREFVLYTRAPEQLQKRFEELRARISSHDLQLMIQLDRNWETYSQLSGSL